MEKKSLANLEQNDRVQLVNVADNGMHHFHEISNDEQAIFELLNRKEVVVLLKNAKKILKLLKQQNECSKIASKENNLYRLAQNYVSSNTQCVTKSFRMPVEMEDILIEFCSRTGLNQKQVICVALERFFEQYDGE